MKSKPHNKTQMQPILVNATQAAELLGIGTRLRWTLSNAGEIPVVRIRGRVLYDPNDLREWIESQKSSGPASLGDSETSGR